MTPHPVARNDPCPCGSGRRYKHCHGAVEAGESALAAATDAGTPNPPEAARPFVLAGPRDDDAGPEPQVRLAEWHRERGEIATAIGLCERALERFPGHPRALVELGLALEKHGDAGGAEHALRRAAETAPDDPLPAERLAQFTLRQHRSHEAALLFADAIERMRTPSAGMLAGLGAALRADGDPVRAEAVLEHATALDPSMAHAWRELGTCRAELEKTGAAALALARAVELDPAEPLGLSLLLHVRGLECVWDGHDALVQRVFDAVDHARPDGSTAVSPFSLHAINDDPMRERAAAVRHAALEFPAPRPPRPRQRAARARLRLGWLSPDLNGHPVGRLLTGLFDRIDRSRFETFAYDCNGPQPDAVWRRLRAACDSFRSIAPARPEVVDEAIREDDIDVLFDLNGFTAGANLSVLTMRPARVQVGFLGYTGTLGSRAVDRIITDRYCVPPQAAGTCVERPLWIDPCYQPRCDDVGDVPADLTREACGLPDDAVVFVAMSAPYKILPERFDAWLDILDAVPGSLLWLRRMGTPAMGRLRHRAATRGVDPARLRFAPNEDVPRYLARFRIADLFLDTAPFGSHTTVNDALGAGLPVLTQAGRTFASRASASMVVAAGLHDLVAGSLEDYVRTAIALGRDRERLVDVRRRLADNRETMPWFDLDAYARAFEGAVARAWDEAAVG
jgi:predicted O-linked N-acetylglucosamine transferase (SPINDLY family)